MQAARGNGMQLLARGEGRRERVGLTPPSCSAPPPERRACAAAELGADHYPPEADVTVRPLY
jgi:hypothetical protein